MNSFIQDFRAQNPTFPGTDEELTLKYGDTYPPDQYEYPDDFVAEYQRLKTSRAVESSGVGQEFSRGFGRGVTGLETSALGGVALAADYLGADRLKNWALESRQRKLEQSAEEEPASVPTIQQATQSLPAFGQYVAGKAGELVPNVGEALGAAAVGTLVAPGPGTVGGAAGVFLRSAAKAAIKREVEKGIESAAIRSVVKKELADFAEGKIEAAALSDATKGVVGKMANYKAATAASMANFAALGAGGGYGELSGTPGVSPEAARTGALIAGAGASLGALIPTQILKGIFGESIGEEAARSYVDLYAKKIPTELLTAGSGMGAMEFFNVIAEHYADPKKQGKDFTKDDYSRILNTAATGVLAGLPAGGISAFRGVKSPTPEESTGGKAPPTPPLAPETPPPPVAPPTAPGTGLEVNYPVPPEARKDMRLMAQADLAGTMNPEEVEAYLAKNPGYRPTYQQIKSEVQDAIQKRETTPVPVGEAPGDSGAVVQGGEKQGAADVQAKTGAAAGEKDVSENLKAAAKDLAPEKQAALGIDAKTGLTKPPPTLDIEATENEIVSLLKSRNEVAAGEFTDEGMRKALGLTEASKGRLSDLVQAGLLTKNENGNYEFSEGIQRKFYPKDVTGKEPAGLTDSQIAARRALFKVFGMTPEEFVKTLDQTNAALAHSDLLDALIGKQTTLPEGIDQASPEGRQAFNEYVAAAKQIEAIAPKSIHEFMDQLGIAEKDRPWKRKEVKPSVEEIKTQEKGDEGRVLTKPTTAAVPEAAAAPAETTWLSNVGNAISAWRTPRAGKEETDMYSDLGRDPKNKSRTRTLGVFRSARSGNIIVASIYDNNGRKVFIGNKGRSWKRATEGGGAETAFQPVGYIKTTEPQEKFYREYTPEQWAEVQRQLEAKRDAAKAEIAPEPTPVSPAAAAEAKLKPVGKATGLDEKPVPLTESDASQIHDIVTKHVGGLPKSEDVREFVGDALAADPNIGPRLAKAAGQDHDNYLSILDQIYAVYDKAAQSGETDPAKLRDTITRELAAIRPETPTSGEKPAQAPGPVVPKPEDRLATRSIGQDRNISPEYQGRAQAVLQAHNGGSAFQALVDLSKSGLLEEDQRKLAEDLAKYGEIGTSLATGGELRNTSGEVAYGKYSPDSNTISVYDASFRDGAGVRSFLHEYVHSLTVLGIEAGRYSGELTLLYNLALESARKSGQEDHYGLTNSSEFIAEAFTNPDFQNFLRGIPSLKMTLWDRFVNFIGNLLGIRDRTLLDDVLNLGSKYARWRVPEIRVQVPDYSRTVQWHTPASGSPETIQTYNAQTGKVEIAPLIPDSVESVLQNVTKPPDPPEYLLPSAGAPKIPERDLSVDHTNQHAMLNKLMEVLSKGIADAGSTLRGTLSMFGLMNPQTAKERLAFEESVKSLQHVERDKTLEGLRWDLNKNEVAVGALGALEKYRSKIGTRVSRAKEEIPQLETRHEEKLNEATETLQNLEDATALSNTINKGMAKIVDLSVRAYGKLGQQAGLAEQMYRDIEQKEGRPIDPNVVNIFRRLSKSDALTGEKMFDFLNQMANDQSLDFSQKASDIRDYIKHAADIDPSLHRYTLLSANDAETKALLSTVIAYGKLNRRMLTLLQIRKMDGPDRIELKQAMEDQYKETTGQLKGGIRMVKKASALSERALAENRELLRQLTEAKRELEHAQSVVYIGEKLLPHYAAEIDRITDKVKQTEDTTFGDGAVFRIPKTNELHPEWDELKLNLGITGTPTTTAELKSAFDKMTAWMKLRENDYDAGNELAKGLDYHRVRQQVYAIGKQKIADPALRATDQTLLGLFMGASAKQMGALGTPVGKLIETAVNKFAGDTTNLRNQSDKEFGYRNQRLWNKVLNVLNQGQAWYQRSKVNGLWFDENIFDKALGFLERGQVGEWQDLKAAQDAWFGKMGQWLLAHDNIRPLIQDRMPQFMAAMRELADSIYMSGGWWVKKNVEAGMLVKDPSLGGRLRMHIDQGLWTFQRKFSNTFFGTVHAMRESGWAEAREAWQNIATLMSQDPAKAEALVDKYMSHPTYGDTVNKALSALTHVPDASVIRSPVLDDVGSKVAAEPGRVAKAYDEANGNLIQMLLKLHDDYNGQDAQADYIQDELVNLADVFGKINAAAKKVEPQSTTEITTFVGLVPNAMIDARELKDLPPEWFNYHRFDNNDNARIAERTAWQINMGREGRELANWHQRAQNDSDYLVHKLEAVLKDAKDATPSGRRRDIDREAARRLMADPDPLMAQFQTGQERLKFLRNVEKRAPFIQSLLRDMNTFFQRGTDSAGSLRWGIRMAGELASLLVNQPSAAIAQLATTVDIMAQWGLSPATLKATARTIQITGKDIAGSLAQGVGWEFLKPSYYEERAWKLGLLSPLAARRMGDIFGALTGEETNRAAKFFRQAKEIQGLTLNLTGERARYTPLQPLSPFFQFVTAANRGLLVSLAEMADGYVTKGVEFLRSHPGSEKITGEDLGLNRFDRNSFEIWQKDHARYGLDFTDMVRGAKERMDSGDRTVITDKELAAINAVALNVISLESNIATMPLWAFNNSVVRFGLPLLGWSYRRAGQLAGLRLNTKDKMSLYAVSNAMLGVAATGLGGLGISLIVDAYSEDVLGKKRNIRSLRVPTTATDWQGIEERLAKVGTFGLWGELVNSAFNVGTGQGDNRMLSVDQRVVAMQSFQSLFRAISAYINQGFDPDYRNVVRPMVGALGGSGLLQYMQIINHAFDLDNVESRVVKRINAENYLRVVGRDLGMSIRTGGGGYGTPTPITPWIARMEFAAYANDPAQFRQAYNGAKAEAKSAGKEDPDTYVRQAFATRHPLRYVFSQVPSEREYRQILANLDDQGKDSVTEAVRLFNYYGQHIGVSPFEGSAKKDQARFTAPERAIQARLRAIGATP